MVEPVLNQINESKELEIIKEDIKWTTISLSYVIKKGKRLEAAVFDIDAKHARDLVKHSKYGSINIEEGNLIQEAYTRPRFKRLWLEKSDYPIYQPTSILDTYPKPDGYISKLTNTDIDALRVKFGQLLITCSGTIGNVSMVSETLDNTIFSHDLLRVRFKREEDNGFFYTFLKTDTGRLILNSNRYGSVITHIEAEHLSEVIIPNAPYIIKKKIHDMIMKSYRLRDKSNCLIDEATELLIKELELPPLEEMKEEAYSYSKEVNSFFVKLSDLHGRLESSYHIPLVDVMEKYMSKNAKLIPLGDEMLTKDIILAGVFKRNYVDKDYGYPFIGGKEITQLNPNVEKFLSRITHKKRYEKELQVKENWILVTDRGTIGTTVLVPKHMEGFAISQNVLKVVPKQYSGYIAAFLNSEYGHTLVFRQKYGSVVNMIDDKSLFNVNIPVLNNEKSIEKIDNLVLKANQMRYEAYLLEEKAINTMNREVIGL